MSTFDFITSIAGLNSAANINGNISATITSASDIPIIKTVVAKEDVLTEITAVDGINLGLIIIHNVDENNDAIVRLEDVGNAVAIDKRLPVGGFMFVNARSFDVSPIGAAFIAFNSTIESVKVEGLDGDAKIKLIYIKA